MAKREAAHGANPGLAALNEAAECLKVLAHPHRLRMLQMLLRGRFTVGELAQACALPSHMASEHLRLMQRCGFLDSVKAGRKAYYRVAEPHLADLLACIEKRFGGRNGRSPRAGNRQRTGKK
jgi:DNA-binding transcriptional ArsR family regulator